MLYPTYSKIKSEHLPPKLRGTLMNVFKIPLNIIVIVLLFSMNTLFELNHVNNKLFIYFKLILINIGVSFVVLMLHMLFFEKKENIYSNVNVANVQNNNKKDIKAE
jgi:hypothetical protein